MGTWYTFTTEIIRDEKEAKKLEDGLISYSKDNDSFGFNKVETINGPYFTGHVKNSGLGFIEWIEIYPGDEISLSWCSDEGLSGSYP